MKLRFKDGEYVFESCSNEDIKVLKEHGVSTFAPRWSRQPAYSTRVPFKALPFWSIADDEAKASLKALKDEYKASKALEGDFSFPVPKGLSYRPFQLAGIDYAMRREHVLIGDQMGTGKTVVAIGIANAMNAKKIVVVCPASLRMHWTEKFAQWSTLPNPFIQALFKTKDGVNPFANFVAVSYNLIVRDSIMSQMPEKIDLLILDEAHMVKSSSAQRTKIIFGKLAGRCEKIVAMTGTPLPNRPRETWTLCKNLCHESIDWQSEDAFINRYNPSFMMPSGFKVEKTGHLPELNARLRCSFMVRRLAKDVLPQMPASQYELIHVSPTGAVKQALKAEGLLNIDPTKLSSVDPEIWGHIAQVRQQMGLAKVPLAAEFIRDILSSEDKLLVAAYHRGVLAKLTEELSEFDPLILIGGLGPLEIHKRKDIFVKDTKRRLCLAQIEVGGIGIDGMQHVCNNAVFVEISWSPKDNDQFLARLARDGQTKPVFGKLLIAEGGWDDKILRSNHFKAVNIFATLDKG